MVQIRAFNIQWDTDQEDAGDLNLPTEVTLKFTPEPDEDLEDQISEELSQLTGFCHKGFQYCVEGDF